MANNDKTEATTALENLTWDDLDILLQGLRHYARSRDCQGPEGAEENAKVALLKTRVFEARRSVNK